MRQNISFVPQRQALITPSQRIPYAAEEYISLDTKLKEIIRCFRELYYFLYHIKYL